MRFAPLALMLVCGLAACGGGSTEPEVPSAPGVLRTLALQGASAPETAGLFDSFDTAPPMDVAAGGWAAFVARTTDATHARCVYAVQPDGSLLLVYHTDEVVPGGGTGTISAFPAVWITSDGLLLVMVDIVGDGMGRTEGLLSARVSGGAVIDKEGVLFNARAMGDIGLAGTLDEIQYGGTYLTDDGWVFADIVTDAAESALLRIASDGSDLTSLVKTTDPLTGGDEVKFLEAIGVDPIGKRYVFVARRDDDTRGIYIGDVELVSYGLVVQDGDDLSEGVVAELPAPQPLLIDEIGRVLFKAVSSENEEHLCVGSTVGPPGFLVVEGDVDPTTDGEYEEMDWLHNQVGSTLPLFQAYLGPNPNGIPLAYFAVTDLVGGTALAMWVNRSAPPDAGEGLRFTSTFPGLAGPGLRDADTNGAFAFANILSNGEPGAFWLLPASGLFTIAVAGQDLPGGGDTFGGANTWRSTTATNVMLFRAPVTGAGSGIFRRGP